MGLKKAALISVVSESVKKANGDQHGLRKGSKNQRWSALFQNGFKKLWLISAVSETFKKTNADQRCLKMCFKKPLLITVFSDWF